MEASKPQPRKRSNVWVAWVALLLLFATGVYLALAKPWESHAEASPSSSPSAPSTSPTPVALTAETAVLSIPDGLTWTGYFTQEANEDYEIVTTGAWPPFMPDGDYPGTVQSVDHDDSIPFVVEGSAPPWFPDMKPFSFVNGEAKGVGDGVAMDAYLVPGGFLQSTAADGTPTAWVIAAFNTDQHSKEPRWAICRFHFTGADSTSQVDAVYCDQAETTPVGDTWDFYDYQWWLDGDTLHEVRQEAWRLEAYGPPEDEPLAPSTFAVGDGPGGFVLTEVFDVKPSGTTATWGPADIGFRVPSEREVGEAWGCDVGDDGTIVHCPES